MKCRTFKNNELTWFNSTGLDLTQPVYENNVLVGYKSKKSNNFSEGNEGIVSGLTQRLSVIKNELWYKMSYGLPLVDKVKSKVFMDSSATSIIMSHPDVVRIESFTSNIVKDHYYLTCKIVTTSGDLVFNL